MFPGMNFGTKTLYILTEHHKKQAELLQLRLFAQVIYFTST